MELPKKGEHVEGRCEVSVVNGSLVVRTVPARAVAELHLVIVPCGEAEMQEDGSALQRFTVANWHGRLAYQGMHN